jgi:hypothetical protein
LLCKTVHRLRRLRHINCFCLLLLPGLVGELSTLYPTPSSSEAALPYFTPGIQPLPNGGYAGGFDGHPLVDLNPPQVGGFLGLPTSPLPLLSGAGFACVAGKPTPSWGYGRSSSPRWPYLPSGGSGRNHPPLQGVCHQTPFWGRIRLPEPPKGVRRWLPHSFGKLGYRSYNPVEVRGNLD